MIGMDGKWTDRLRKRMQDFEEPEPEGLWQAVSDAMDKSGTAPVHKPARAGKKALALFTVSDLPLTGESLSAEDRQLTFTQMMEIALEIAE